MPSRRQLLYYQLLKYSAEDSLCGNVLDRAVDGLCNAPSLQLAGASLRTQLDGLVQTSKEFGVLSVLEVAHWCSEIDWHLRSDGEAELAPVLLVRALEVAGVAYGISLFTSDRNAQSESRLCTTQGLKHLLVQQGDQVLQDVAARVNAFQIRFVSNTLASQAKLQSLLALKQAHASAYQILRRHEACRSALKSPMPPKQAVSAIFEEVQSDLLKSPKNDTPNKTSFQVDVVAGLECLDFNPQGVCCSLAT